jgi:hypothetical protein
MLSEDMRGVYRRLSVLGLLSVCLIVFSFSPVLESVYAAPCVEECEDTWAICLDNCPDDCNTADANCSSCGQSCNFEYWDCMSHAVFCNTGYSYTPQCSEVNFGLHCPESVGYPCTQNQGGHQGYHQTCNRIAGQCRTCPPNELCDPSLPRCF